MTENMKECLAQTKTAVGDMVTVVKTEVCSPLRDQEYGQPCSWAQALEKPKQWPREVCVPISIFQFFHHLLD
ncbi:PR domain-containing protein 11 [Saguinus oedipus]|uniref:PR domain-containing protein 11 n=1 Tax=Saguinus oedipus TaxID=9490 RepID=A0ABQ9UUN5_SAGOE|nr:PR domain-containing protein 11 [Saguinus oedipus]